MKRNIIVPSAVVLYSTITLLALDFYAVIVDEGEAGIKLQYLH